MATDAYSFVQRVWKNGEIFLFYGWWIGYGHFGTKQDTKRKRVTKNKTLNLSDCGTLLYGCYILPFDRFATKQNGNFISIILYTHQRYASTPHTHTVLVVWPVGFLHLLLLVRTTSLWLLFYKQLNCWSKPKTKSKQRCRRNSGVCQLCEINVVFFFAKKTWFLQITKNGFALSPGMS